MIQIVLASHGDFCMGLKQTTEMIAGKCNYLDTISFRPGESPENFQVKFDKVLKDTAAIPTLVLVDLKGGTPFNTAMFLKQSHNLEVITGVNLSMVLSLVTSRNEESSIDDLIKVALNENNWGIQHVKLGGTHHAKLSLN